MLKADTAALTQFSTGCYPYYLMLPCNFLLSLGRLFSLALCLGLILLCAACPKNYISPKQRREMLQMAEDIEKRSNAPAGRPAGVSYGNALPFRSLQSSGSYFGLGASLFSGNLDSDPDDELFVERGNLILELDGTSRRSSVGKIAGFNILFDFNGDGVDDILEKDFGLTGNPNPLARWFGATDRMRAWDLQGQELGPLEGHPMGPQILPGDFDGDGRGDLFMSESGDYGPDPKKGVRAFAPGGKVIISAGPEWNSPYVQAGDLDGDGADEIISQVQGQLQTLSVAHGAQPLRLGSKIETVMSGQIDWCFDCDGDGRDEVFNRNGQFFNLTTGSAMQLECPPDLPEISFDAMFARNVQGFHDGSEARIAALLGESLSPETLTIWDGTGKLLYSENLGEKGRGIAIAEAGGIEHLCVMTSSRVLVWP